MQRDEPVTQTLVEIEVLLPPKYSESVFFDVEPTISIERVKRKLFTLIDDFPEEFFSSFVLGVSPSEILLVEFIRFVTSHPKITECAQNSHTITVYLVSHVDSSKSREIEALLLQRPQKSSSICHSMPTRRRNLINRPNQTSNIVNPLDNDMIPNWLPSPSLNERKKSSLLISIGDGNNRKDHYESTDSAPETPNEENINLPVDTVSISEMESKEVTMELTKLTESEENHLESNHQLDMEEEKQEKHEKIEVHFTEELICHEDIPEEVKQECNEPLSEIERKFPITVSLSEDFSFSVITEGISVESLLKESIFKLQKMLDLCQKGTLINEEGRIAQNTDWLSNSQHLKAIPANLTHLFSKRHKSLERVNVSKGTRRKPTIALGYQRTSFSPRELFKSEKLMGVQIGSLIGKPLIWGEKEPHTKSARTNVLKGLEGFRKCKFVDVSLAKIDSFAPDYKVMSPRFKVAFLFHDAVEEEQVLCELGTLLFDCASEILTKLKLKPLSSYFIKISGCNEYILDNVPLLSIEQVRNDVICKREPRFVLVPKAFVQDPLATFFENKRLPNIVQYGKAFISHTAPSVSISTIKAPFEVRVIGLELREGSIETTDNLFVECSLYHGESMISNAVRTPAKTSDTLLFLSGLTFDIETKDVPKETRILFSLFADNIKGKELIGWATLQLVSYANRVIDGVHKLGLWRSETPEVARSPVNCKNSPFILLAEIPRSSYIIMHDISTIKCLKKHKKITPSEEEETKLLRILKNSAMYSLSAPEKELFWKYRKYLKVNFPNALKFVAASVQWDCLECVQEFHGVLSSWDPLDPYRALELLDYEYADELLRTFAVRCLHSLTNSQVTDLMLQFIQIVKSESFHDSSLVRFLLHRALQDRGRIGHVFFWYLRGEIFAPEFSDRFAFLAEIYLRCCGDHRTELMKQVELVSKLKRIAVHIQKIPLAKRNDELQKQLAITHFKSGVKLPSSGSIAVKELELSKCKAKDSFTAPLWLVWCLKDRTPAKSLFPVIFKVGDDLRQDTLTLQAIRIMDTIWKGKGLDMHMSLYSVLSTGSDMGFIEVVRDAASIADIQKSAGGATATFQKTPLQRWLRQHNPTEEEYERAVRKFTYSCAGYSVASFILGLGDRHNDNIMVTSAGKLFHIDFSHFMGNIMKWKGIKRETAPFVLTPEIAYVMGGEKGEAFTTYTKMRHTGIPQLNCKEDIEYMHSAFMLDLTEEQASAAFVKLITKCLSSVATRANFLIHILAHPDKD